jgi:hypothetical protein
LVGLAPAAALDRVVEQLARVLEPPGRPRAARPSSTRMPLYASNARSAAHHARAEDRGRPHQAPAHTGHHILLRALPEMEDVDQVLGDVAGDEPAAARASSSNARRSGLPSLAQHVEDAEGRGIVAAGLARTLFFAAASASARPGRVSSTTRCSSPRRSLGRTPSATPRANAATRSRSRPPAALVHEPHAPRSDALTGSPVSRIERVPGPTSRGSRVVRPTRAESSCTSGRPMRVFGESEATR